MRASRSGRGTARKRSKRSKDRGACPSGKRRFRDHPSAVAALRRTGSSSREVRPVRAYECDRCQGWHLTSWEHAGEH